MRGKHPCYLIQLTSFPRFSKLPLSAWPIWRTISPRFGAGFYFNQSWKTFIMSIIEYHIRNYHNNFSLF